MDSVGNGVAWKIVASPEIRVVSESNPSVELVPETGPEIRLVVHKPGGTPRLRRVSAVTVVSILRDAEIRGYRLKLAMLVELHRARRESLATTWLEGVAEYGTGKTDDEAITDLVVSLGEYRECLEKRERSLGNSARKELDCLRRLIERS